MFLAGGLTVGGVAVLMAWLADKAQEILTLVLHHAPDIGLVATPIGFGIAVYLSRHVFPNSQGSGIPQVIAALQIEDKEQRSPLVSLRVAVGKIVVMTLGLLFGASTGREGPTVQVGGAIMYALGHRAPYRQAGFLLAGAAAGVSAAFNTPLAGIVFGIEELSRSFETRTSGLIIGAVIAAGLTSLALVGDYSYFGSTAAILPLGSAWAAIPIGAVAGGLSGGVFIRIVLAFAGGLSGRFGAAIARQPILFAMLCGFGVALCGLHGDTSVFGTGYAEARAIVHASANIDYWFAPLKFIATTLSTISGIPGGLFSPSLSIGAGEGALLRLVFPHVPLGALALIGMVSFLTGVTHAPITAFVIVSEMTDDHAMIIPLMIAALVAEATSRLMSREGLYHALSHHFLAKAETAGHAK
ncbi:chloride channel protein [Rhodoblastus acidophilus]|uniref:Chloride channel protein n=1 Tax=Candidatus Rhodoblastus alkanivorans TaxID=2954117 RepID=A0ABS9Z8W3_9HYPH|nr:chloride channel protein [Candidatus Rhodoblastus alkanivorans]MCI4679310.1 chloride channel protein [Candidatus Rhodoblastus alkanivorans]MCI4684063.1 chloride channel protein [Candidatus Rhodoblastus alkanivorans]MDI4641383.1 chloride channel protein [Rhodoblastus acidophilus]